MSIKGALFSQPNQVNQPVVLHKPGTGRVILRCLSYLRPYRHLVFGGYD